MTGEVTADVLVAGRPEAPVISVTATVIGSEFALATIDTLEVAGSFSRATADIGRLHLVSNYGTVDLNGQVAHPGAGVRDFWPGAALELTAEVTDGDWAFVDQFEVPALDRIAGRFTGELKVGGTTESPVIEGELASAPFHIHWLHMDQMSGHVTVDAERLILARLAGNKGALAVTGHLEVPLFVDLLSEPAANEEGPFLMRLSLPAESDLEPLARATNGFYESSGRGQAEVVISGPLNHPVYEGSVALHDVGFVLRGQQEIYRDCSVVGTFSGDELRISELQGEEGEKGTFHGSGHVLFDGLKLKTFDLRLAADRFLISTIPDLRVLVRTQNARINGEVVGPDSVLVPKFSGDLEVIRARYTGDFSETAGGGDPRQGNVAPDWLADVNIDAPPRSGRIVNRAMEIYLSGNVNLVRDLEGLFLRGTMIIDAGRLPVFNNNFKVVQGRLDFSQEIGLAPMIDLDAETRVRLRSRYGNTTITERITVHVSGTISKPEISYSSESGYSQSGIERMLLGMSPYASDDDAARLTNTSISAGFNLVEREIARELNIVDTFEIEQIDRVSSASAPGFDPLIGVGKYLGQDLYVKYAQGLDPNDRDILIEYQIGRHVLLQSEIRRRLDEYQGEDSYSFDLKYRFEY
jgi:autotransporter translocation and assembly factor TamB